MVESFFQTSQGRGHDHQFYRPLCTSTSKYQFFVAPYIDYAEKRKDPVGDLSQIIAESHGQVPSHYLARNLKVNLIESIH